MTSLVATHHENSKFALDRFINELFFQNNGSSRAHTSILHILMQHNSVPPSGIIRIISKKNKSLQRRLSFSESAAFMHLGGEQLINMSETGWMGVRRGQNGHLLPWKLVPRTKHF